MRTIVSPLFFKHKMDTIPNGELEFAAKLISKFDLGFPLPRKMFKVSNALAAQIRIAVTYFLKRLILPGNRMYWLRLLAI